MLTGDDWLDKKYLRYQRANSTVVGSVSFLEERSELEGALDAGLQLMRPMALSQWRVKNLLPAFSSISGHAHHATCKDWATMKLAAAKRGIGY